MIDWSQIKGFIFDNDGVIVNSEPLSCGALRQLFEERFNVDIGTDFDPVLGTSDSYAIKYYADRYNKQIETIDELIDRKMEIYYDMAESKLSHFPQFHQLMKFLRSRYDLAVASSGNHDKIKFSLDQVDASTYFPIICSATEVERGKPAPDLFLYTARCMGLHPSTCVVIEDSVKGIQAASRAGMKTIGFTSSFSAAILKEAGADLTIDRYQELIFLLSNSGG